MREGSARERQTLNDRWCTTGPTYLMRCKRACCGSRVQSAYVVAVQGWRGPRGDDGRWYYTMARTWPRSVCPYPTVRGRMWNVYRTVRRYARAAGPVRLFGVYWRTAGAHGRVLSCVHGCGRGRVSKGKLKYRILPARCFALFDPPPSTGRWVDGIGEGGVIRTFDRGGNAGEYKTWRNNAVVSGTSSVQCNITRNTQ